VQARLASLRGTGPWSAQMFLLRSHAIKMLDGLHEVPKVKPADQRALAWHPWRSHAAKYLWIS